MVVVTIICATGSDKYSALVGLGSYMHMHDDKDG